MNRRLFLLLTLTLVTWLVQLNGHTNNLNTDRTTHTQTHAHTIPTTSATISSLPHSQQRQRHALLVAIPLPGHLNPLISQGFELHRRGWNVTIASPSRMSKHFHSVNKKGELKFMDLGECPIIAELHGALERAANQEDYMESAREMFEWAIHLHSCMYSSLYGQIPKLPTRPNIVIADFATYAGFDVADAFGIPFMVNNPDLLNMMSPDDVAPYDFVPGVMTASSISTVSGPESGYGLLLRTIYPPLRVFIRWIGELTTGAELEAEQKRVGVKPTGLFTRLAGKVVLVNNVFGLEYARSLTPNVVLVGPMLEKKWQPLTQARAEYVNELSVEDKSWLDWRSSSGGTLPVIWVSMGTIAPLNMRQVNELYTTFALGVRSGKFRVLWKLDPSDHKYLPTHLPDSNMLRITTWVSSQLGVLAHEATQIFISHCGINSVHESVYIGTKLLCIPILADQADMAARVYDAGVGSYLSKSTFTATNVSDHIDALLSTSNLAAFDRSLTRARSAMQLAGGVERAVDYIEFVDQFGSDALVPISVGHPWYVRQEWDIFFIHLTILYLLYRLFRCCCCTHRPGRECVEDRKKNRTKVD